MDVYNNELLKSLIIRAKIERAYSEENYRFKHNNCVYFYVKRFILFNEI